MKRASRSQRSPKDGMDAAELSDEGPDSPTVGGNRASIGFTASPGGFTMHAASDGVKLQALKTGYLIKRPSIQKRGNKMKFWSGGKRKFFVLRGNSFTYHRDHTSIDDRETSREVLLTAESDVSDFYDPPHANFGFYVTVSKDMVLQLVAADVMERQEWKDAILVAIGQVKGTTRGYLLKRNAGLPLPALGSSPGSDDEAPAVWEKKFFVLSGRRLTIHADHSRAITTQGYFDLCADTQVEKRPRNVLLLQKGEVLMALQAESPQECQRWAAAIADTIVEARTNPTAATGARETVGDDDSAAPAGRDSVEEGTSAERGRSRSIIPSGVPRGETELQSGYLFSRQQSGSEDWLPNRYVLTARALYRFPDEHYLEPMQVYVMTPSCSVFETNLKAFSFELVTANQVLHVQGANYEHSLRWIAVLKGAINDSAPDGEDPLLVEALKLTEDFYDVTFETKQPLGVVLERSKEWAVVKLANSQTTAVTVGSALAAVNGHSVVLRAYHETIQLLTGWKPPLHLVFRRAPQKSGWLKKQGTSKKRRLKVWKPSFFVLAEGKLSWFNADGPTAKLQGVVPLMGSAVSLMPFATTGEQFCFSVVSGITTLALQGLTAEDMMDWATHLYHASAIANGGGHLLDIERAREKAYDEERQRRVEAEAASIEAAQRKAAEEAAAAEAAQAAAAETKAREERQAAEAASGPTELDEAGRERLLAEARAAEDEAARLKAEADARQLREEEEARKAEQAAEDAQAALREMEFRREQLQLKAEEHARKKAEERKRTMLEVDAAMRELLAKEPVAASHRHLLREMNHSRGSGGGGGSGTSPRRASLRLSSTPLSGGLALEARNESGDAAMADRAAKALSLNLRDFSVAQLRRAQFENSVSATSNGDSETGVVKVDFSRETEGGDELTHRMPSAVGEGNEEEGDGPGEGASTTDPSVQKAESGMDQIETLPPTPTQATSHAMPTPPSPVAAVGLQATQAFQELESADSNAGNGDAAPVPTAAALEAGAEKDAAQGAARELESPAVGATAVTAAAEGSGTTPKRASVLDRWPLQGKQPSNSNLGSMGSKEKPLSNQQSRPVAAAAAAASTPVPPQVTAKLVAIEREVQQVEADVITQVSLKSKAFTASAAELSPRRSSNTASTSAEQDFEAAVAFYRASSESSTTTLAPDAATTAHTGHKEAEQASPLRPLPLPEAGFGQEPLMAPLHPILEPAQSEGEDVAPPVSLARPAEQHIEKSVSVADLIAAKEAKRRAEASSDALDLPHSGSRSGMAPPARAVSGRIVTAAAAFSNSAWSPPKRIGDLAAAPAGFRRDREHSGSVSPPPGHHNASRESTLPSTPPEQLSPASAAAAAAADAHRHLGSRRASRTEMPCLDALRHEQVAESQVVEWIEAVTNQPFDAESGKDLHANLKDGRRLLELVEKIRPGLVAPASDSPLAYKQMDNVTRFLKACRQLGVSESSLFETVDLCESRDLSLVVRCVHALGRTVQSTCPDFPGPHIRTTTASFASMVAGGGGSVSTLRRNGSAADAAAAGDSRGAAMTEVALNALNGHFIVPDDSDSDEEDENAAPVDEHAILAGGAVAAAAVVAPQLTSPRAPVQQGGGRRGGNGAKKEPLELSDEELERAFHSLDMSTQSGHLNAMQFSSLWRVLTGTANLFKEMETYSRFNVSGDSNIDLPEFKAGFRRLQQELGHNDPIFVNLKAWTNAQTVSF